MRSVLSCLILILLAAPASAGDYPARVVGVTDGDTLTVLTAEKKPVKVRLWGIDAPETGQDFGTNAKQAASGLAFGKDVTIRERGRDRYGRTVAEVMLPDGRSLNRELVGQGMAWWYREYAPGDKELETLEGEARAGKRGLWAGEKPTPPWEWRHPKVVDTGQVVGNRHSHLFHAPYCVSAAKTKESNRVAFKSIAEAEAAGYRKARDCRWRATKDGPKPGT